MGNITHGHTVGKDSPEYRCWRDMLTRCERSYHISFPNYGGRGITVCEQWKVFANFLADMGLKPSPAHTIDRVDNSRGYEPGNCRWASRKDQLNNTRRTIFVEHQGLRLSVKQWCERLDLNYNAILKRIKSGESPETAFTGRRRPPFKHRAKGVQPMLPVLSFQEAVEGSREANAFRKAGDLRPIVVHMLTDLVDRESYYLVKRTDKISRHVVHVWVDRDDRQFIRCDCPAASPPLDAMTRLPRYEPVACMHAASVLIHIAKEGQEDGA